MNYIHFTTEQLAQARSINLYDYMLQKHAEDVEKCGFGVIQLKTHDSLKIKKGWSGFYRHSTGDHGDAIRFLQEYYGLEFRDAVLELLGSGCDITSLSSMPKEAHNNKRCKDIPVKKEGYYKNIMAYLYSRGISASTIRKLIDAELLYQDVNNNAVFIHKNKNFAELKGTYTYSNKAYRKTINLTGDKSLYWSFGTGGPRKKELAYITESAIDAVSLYEIHVKSGKNEAADYCSCAGASRYDAIAKIIEEHLQTIIAVDNDDAGNRCAQRYQELKRIIPVYKDWNEDLIYFQKGRNTLTKEGM